MSDKDLGCETASKINAGFISWAFLYSPLSVQCTDLYRFVQCLMQLCTVCAVNSLFGSKRTKKESFRFRWRIWKKTKNILRDAFIYTFISVLLN